MMIFATEGGILFDSRFVASWVTITRQVNYLTMY